MSPKTPLYNNDSELMVDYKAQEFRQRLHDRRSQQTVVFAFDALTFNTVFYGFENELFHSLLFCLNFNQN